MKSEMVERFFSDDGKEFTTSQECIEYENRRDFRRWYMQDYVKSLDTDFSDPVPYIFDWLMKYKEDIKKFLA